MATPDDQAHRTPVPIAPAPAKRARSAGLGIKGAPPQSTMPYICKTCSRRKVKCDKVTPICSACRKGKLECIYQPPPPRSRKRKLSGDVLERLARYERILQQHGLLDSETSPSTEVTPPQEPTPFGPSEPEMSESGKLLTGQGRSRYIESKIWHNLGDDEMQHMSDGEEETHLVPRHAIVPGNFISDPLAGALMGSHKKVLEYHPTYENAMELWKTHIENVEPICKVLHIPSISKMVESASQHAGSASRADECLLFAIYHTAVFSMADEECSTQFGQARSILMTRYHFATRQALVNASFLKTTEMSVLQALFLFLLSSRNHYDSHTYWILTGVALRIAQRMGLHRDGEKLGLPPFDVEMRRRLIIQLYPLDGRASQVCGTDMTTMPESWDIQLPLNINDEQIWPGMTEKPVEQKGATDMIFCLSRACFGKFLAGAGQPINGAGPWEFKEYHEAERLINAAENEVEERFIRYCDIVNPLHFLTIGLARSGMTALRLKIRLPKVRNQIASDAERIELFQLSQKTLNTDAAVHAHSGLSKYQWHVRPFFLWGTWDSLIFVLTTLWKRRDLLSPPEIEAAWKNVVLIYQNHDELLESKKALHMALGRLSLKAWDAQQLAGDMPEPAFIATLKLRQIAREKRKHSSERIDITGTTLLSNPSPTGEATASFGGASDGMSLDFNHTFNLEAEDWVFWDQLIKDHQVQDIQQQD